MSANLLPPTPVIKDWLAEARRQLEIVGITSAALDTEIILADVLGQDRTFLHAHPEQIINSDQCKFANKNLELRLDRTPIAYIIGHKEFYGRQFTVTPATLIPRPESEDIITILGQILPTTNYQSSPTTLIDVGTGSGCLGITAKLEFPALNITLADISNEALKIASQNANNLSADVTIIKSDLLQNYPTNPDIIIANLPYVDLSWDRSPETNHEPDLALFADDHGQLIIKKLITQAKDILTPDGHLIIEADPVQYESLIEFAKKQSFTVTHQRGYVLAFTRLTRNPCIT